MENHFCQEAKKMMKLLKEDIRLDIIGVESFARGPGRQAPPHHKPGEGYGVSP